MSSRRYKPIFQSQGEQSLSNRRVDRVIDPIPFTLLYKKHPFALTFILAESPHVLSSRDLLKSGCSVRQLKHVGYTTMDLLCVYGSFYSHFKAISGQHWGPITGLLSTAAGGIISICQDSTIRVWDNYGVQDQCTRRWDVQDGRIDHMIALDGNLIATAEISGVIKVWDSISMECKRSINAHTGHVFSLAKLTDGRLASASSFLPSEGGAVIKLWDIETGECIGLKRLNGDGHIAESVHAMVQLKCGMLVSAGIYGLINLRDPIRMARESPQGTNDSIGGTVDNNVPDVADARAESILYGHTETVRALLLLPNDRMASGSNDCTIRLWDVSLNAVRGRECLVVLKGHTAAVICLCLLGDNETLASGSWDSTVRIWDCDKGECMSVLKGYLSGVQSIAVLSDGVTIASGSRDKTIRLWRC